MYKFLLKINIEQYRKSRNGKPSEIFFLCTVITDAHQYTRSIYLVNKQWQFWQFTIKIRHERKMPAWCLLSLSSSFSFAHSSSSSCFFILQILIFDSSTHIFFIFSSNKISERQTVGGDIFIPHLTQTHTHIFIDYICASN